jgi:hypothetical protein
MMPVGELFLLHPCLIFHGSDMRAHCCIFVRDNVLQVTAFVLMVRLPMDSSDGSVIKMTLHSLQSTLSIPLRTWLPITHLKFHPTPALGGAFPKHHYHPINIQLAFANLPTTLFSLAAVALVSGNPDNLKF